MLIIALLFVLGGVIFIAWLFVLFPPSTPKSKYRSQGFKQSPLPPKSTKSSDISPQNFVRQSSVPTQKAFLAKNFKKQLLPSPARIPRVRLPKNLKKHLNNIEYASQVLEELRSITPIAKLPVGAMRKCEIGFYLSITRAYSQ